MPELMRADPYLAVFRDRQIGIDFRLIDGACTSRQHPFVRPDIIVTARLLGAGTGMNHDEGVDESITVIVIGYEIDLWIRGRDGIKRHGLRVGSCGSHAGATMSVALERLRQSKRPCDGTLKIDKPVRHVAIVFAHTFLRLTQGEE